jgi:ribosomal protein S21
MKQKTDEQILQEMKHRKVFEEKIYDGKRKANEISKYLRRDAEKK